MGRPEATAAALPARRFRPALWPALCASLTFILLVGLGSWQVQRLFWKQAADSA